MNNNIDERIYKVCENAEKEYSQSHSQRYTYNNYNIKNIENGNNALYGQNLNIKNNINNNLSESYSKIAKINNKSIDSDINVLSKIKFGQINQIENKNKNQDNYSNMKSPFNKKSDNYTKKIALYNLENSESNIKFNKTAQNFKKKSNSISKNNHNISHKKNIDLSKILLESRDLIKKLKIKQAYILLNETILLNIQHSDLFYLFGEVNRLIKHYDKAENYLIKALKFELHSPYVFYSLGLLYQEIKQFHNSNKFFNLFSRLIDNADLHFNKAINFLNLNDLVHSCEEITKAIEINEQCEEYYLLRSEIWKRMGMKEMENEDNNMYNFIIKKKKEEEEY